MNNRICFIITTFVRDELLYKSVESLLPYIKQNKDWCMVIVDQGELSSEKEEWLDKNGIDSLNYSRKNNPQQLFYYQVPFDSGLSYCRNYGVKKAKDLGCTHCVIGSDSFLFNETIKQIDYLRFDNYDLCGFELGGCKVSWEAELKLIEGQSIELDFIDKSIIRKFYPIDICRNFFIATTDSLLNSPWDNRLKLAEHELFFLNYKQNGYKCVWTPLISATKMTDRPTKYVELRKKNFNEGQQKLREILRIKGWVSYVNLQRAKDYYKGEKK